MSNAKPKVTLSYPSTYPAHFKPADIEAVERVIDFINDPEHQHTQSSVARLSRQSTSSINQVLKGTYLSPPTKILAAIESAIKGIQESNGVVVEVVETSTYKLAMAACQMARKNRNFSVLSGYVGTGKTFALKDYVSKNSNTFLLEATPTMNAASLLKKLAGMVCSFSERASQDALFNMVVSGLKNTDALLIIDEAETLTAKQLHILRRIRDTANVGIVLAGTEHLSGLIKPEFGQFDQIRSRTGFWPETVKKITLEDAAAICQVAFGLDEELSDEFIQRLYDYSRGSARMLTEGLISAIKDLRQNHELSVKLVDAVAKQALCLKVLP